MRLCFAIGLLLIMILKVAGGQEIILSPLSYRTPCTDGLRSNSDLFVFNATLGENFTALAVAGWDTIFYIEMLSHGSTTFEAICGIIIGPTGGGCNITHIIYLCHCYQLNALTGKVYATVNHPAELNFSQGIIRGSWINQSLKRTIYSKNNLTLRVIYDVNTASLELKVNGRPATGKRDSCGINFVSEKDNTISLCCSNTASPCYPRISFDGQVVARGKEKCAEYTYKPQEIYRTVKVTLSYSVCTQSDYITAYSCLIKTERDVSTTTIQTALTPTAESPEVVDDIICKIIIGVLIPLIIIAAVTVGLICYYKKARGSPQDLGNTTPQKDSKHEESIKPDSGSSTGQDDL